MLVKHHSTGDRVRPILPAGAVLPRRHGARERDAPVEAPVKREAPAGATAAPLSLPSDSVLILSDYGLLTRFPAALCDAVVVVIDAVFIILGSGEQHADPEAAVETLDHQHAVVLELLEVLLGEGVAPRVAAPARPVVQPRALVERYVVEVDCLDAYLKGGRRLAFVLGPQAPVILGTLLLVRQDAVGMLDLVYGV